MATRMQQRRGTATQWTTANPILGAGEIGYETDTAQFKIGDGINHWATLSYFKNLEDLNTDGFLTTDDKAVANGLATLDSTGKIPVGQLGNLIDGAPNLLNTLNEISAAINDDENFGTTVLNAIDQEALDRASAVTNAIDVANGYADSLIENEITDRGLAITAAINQEITDRNNAITSASDAIATDIANITDPIIQDLADEVQNRTDAINTEVTNRNNAISDAIDLEVIARDSAIAVETGQRVTGIQDAMAQTLLDASAEAVDIVTTSVSNHNLETTNIHGIDDTSDLVVSLDLSTAIDNHNLETLNVHGILDTSELATQTDAQSYADQAQTDAETTASGYVSTHNSATTNVHGISDTSILVTTTGSQTLSNKTIASPTVTISATTTNLYGPQSQAYVVAGDNSGGEGGTYLGIGEGWLPIIGWPETAEFYVGKTLVISGASVSAWNGSWLIDSATLAGGQLKLVGSTFAYNPTMGAQAPTMTLTQVNPSKTISSTELGHLDGVSSAIQTQLDSKTTAGYVNSQVNSHVALTTSVHGITDTSKIVMMDSAATTLDGDLTIDGDFTVNGTNFSASATSITIEDNLVQLAHSNVANTVDLGIVVGYNDGAAKHSGIVRDVSADKWKLFKGVTTEPSTTVDFTQGSLDDLEVNNITASGVVFTDGTQTKEGVPSQTPIIQKTASYTLSSLTERDDLIEMNSASAITLTIPADSAVNYPIGTSLDILQTGVGTVTIAGDAGVTVNATPGLKLRTQWSSATLFKRAADTWIVYGDLKA